MRKWKQLRRYRYLLIASTAIVIAVFALLIMQYRSARQAQEYAGKTLKANLELHLLEISEDAKRGVIEHATHIIHSLGQTRFRTRDFPSIEQALTRATKRYPEIDDCYFVYFERGQENETWRLLKFVRPDANDPDVQKFEGSPVGRMVEDAEASASIFRAWRTVQKQSQSTLYATYDPAGNPDEPVQYFVHTVYEADTLDRNRDLENIGLIVIRASPDRFPSPTYFDELVAKHQNRDKEINGLIGKLEYGIDLRTGGKNIDLLATNNIISPTSSRSFDPADRLFPNLTFSIAAPDIEAKAYANDYIQSSIFLGLIAAVAAFLGLGLTWRATRREIQVGQMKADFLANISHELKTPLTAIRAFGDLLHSGRTRKPERIAEYGGIIKTESDRLTTLINNILEMSRIERGVRKYRMEAGDLRETVTETLDIFRHSPEAARFEIKTTLPLKPILTRFDKGAIRQAVLNLLSNAAKYSGNNDDSQIIVELRGDANEAIIEVRDFGIGISAEDQRSIFLPFHRSSNDEIQAKGGTGLGLPIVRELARGHGGEVTLVSDLGQGSVFQLHLPIFEEERNENQEVLNGSYLGHRRRA